MRAAWVFALCVFVAASPYNPNEYEVVRNHVEYIVGQLVGAGVAVSGIVNGTQTELCLPLDPEIPRDPESLYPVADFGGYDPDYYGPGQPKWWPLGLNVIVVGDHVEYCANVTSNGSYYPILRLDDWEYATGVATTTTTSVTTTTPPPTTTTTAAPTALGAGAIVGIVVGSLLGAVCIFVLIYLVCCMRRGRASPQEQMLSERRYAWRPVRMAYRPDAYYSFKGQ